MSKKPILLRQLFCLNALAVLFCLLLYFSEFRPRFADPLVCTFYPLHKTETALEVRLDAVSPVWEQEFYSMFPDISSFQLDLTDRELSRESSLKVSLAQSGRPAFFEQTLTKENLKGKIEVLLPADIPPTLEQSLTLTLSLEGADSDWLLFSASDLPGFIRQVNQNPSDSRNLLYDLSYSCLARLKPFFILIVCLLLLFVNGAWFLFCIRGWLLSRAFPLLALSFGLITTLVIPVDAVPDEYIHYNEVTYYSNILCSSFSGKEDRLNKRKIDALQEDVLGNTLEPNHYFQLQENLFRKPSKEQCSIMTVPFSHKLSIVPSLVYYPAALGLSIGRWLHLSGFMALTLARVFNLFAYILLCFLALFLLPCKKDLFAAFMLLPITIQQAASVSYDAVLNGLLFLFIALCFQLYFSGKPAPARLLLLAVLVVLIAMSKGGVYTPLFLLILLPCRGWDLPSRLRKRFGPAGFLLLGCVLLLLVIAAIGLCLWKVYPVLKILLNEPAVPADPEEALYSASFLLAHPQKIVYLFWNTFHQGSDSILQTLLGGKLSWLDVKLNWLFLIPELFCILILANEESDQLSLDRFSRSILCLSAVGSTFLIMLSMLIAYTSVSSDRIIGIQGRYFLAVAPLPLISFPVRILRVDEQAGKKTAFTFCLTIALMMMSVPVLC